MEKNYANDELMVIEASRYIDDGDTVLVGTGLPMVASLFAQKNHAPHMCYVVETGPIGPDVTSAPISVTDPRLMHGAARVGSLLDSLGAVLQRGLADVAFLGGAEIDQFGNVNSTVIGDYKKPRVRFPGSGGANDPGLPRQEGPHHHRPRETSLPPSTAHTSPAPDTSTGRTAERRPACRLRTQTSSSSPTLPSCLSTRARAGCGLTSSCRAYRWSR